MHDLPDIESLSAVLAQPIDPKLHTLLADRLSDTIACGLEDYTHVIVIEAEDDEDVVEEAIGFSPLRSRIDNLPATPDWDWIERHGEWIELLYVIGNSGHAVIAFVQDAVHSPFAALCRSHGT